MANVTVIFLFQQPGQWVPLTGSTPGSGLCTPNMIVIDPGAADVTVSGSSNGSVVYGGTSYATYPAAGTTIQVLKGRQPTFLFAATDGTLSSSSYLLTGIALKNLSTNLSGGGTASFPGVEVSTIGRTGYYGVTLQDNNSGAESTSTSYDFWVMAQNAAGDVGLIDPLITNQD